MEGFLISSLAEAVRMLWSLDPELYFIVYVSLYVSFFSTLIAAVLGIPLGFLVAVKEFRGKRAVITILNTLLALPTVVIGIFVYAFLSRRGILGDLGMLYTPWAIVVGQVILITPWVTTFTLAAVSRIDSRYRRTAMTLGANLWQTSLSIAREARYGILAAIIAAFGRAIAEIGIAMMLGGNIKGFTRTMTTAMALEHNKGEFILALGLGIVLLSISLFMNIFMQLVQGRYGSAR
ncbi:binding-protein-dependent transport systems inner membrane component [Desulfonatronospira thiodismutans ASO3-1]|uniref:Binding-protein-dependent transport systems inner membrane component n=1 Tax=Desulfonatronospira thiodismutans ASO3-1 TaxID=555779 RepID=D6SNI9_9BACT|nr:ABC transporter permease [Desulfonatronospira thiodismutans]EFI34315.1 binding-protein-dependent transport systems inner membrane component [Desulfonatronospira thiodismutans ASO3-1]